MLDLNNLPDELLLYIFLFLERSDLIKIARTCKKYKEIAYDNFLWKQSVDFNLNRYNFFGLNLITNREIAKTRAASNFSNSLTISNNLRLPQNLQDICVTLQALLDKMFNEPWNPIVTSSGTVASGKLAAALNLCRHFLVLNTFPEEIIFNGRTIMRSVSNDVLTLFGNSQLMLETGNTVNNIKNKLENFCFRFRNKAIDFLQETSQKAFSPPSPPPPLTEAESINLLSIGMGILAMLLSSANYSFLEYWQICLSLLFAVSCVSAGLQGLGLINMEQEEQDENNMNNRVPSV